MRFRMHCRVEFFVWEVDCRYSRLKATCGQLWNALLFATLGSAIFPEEAEKFQSHTDPSIRLNEGRAFVIE